METSLLSSDENENIKFLNLLVSIYQSIRRNFPLDLKFVRCESPIPQYLVKLKFSWAENTGAYTTASATGNIKRNRQNYKQDCH
jgi:hypothetical protein